MPRLLLLCLFLGAAVLPAQTFRASLIAGANFSQIDGDDLFGYHQFGANAGIRVVALLGARWRIGPEILFSQIGARRNASSLNISAWDRFDLSTIEVPLMAYYQDWRIMGEFGISYQNLFNYTVIASSDDDVTAATELREDLLNYKLGATFFITPNWALNIRFTKHLTNIDIDNSLNTSFKGKSVSVRAIFTLGKGETIPSPPEENR